MRHHDEQFFCVGQSALNLLDQPLVSPVSKAVIELGRYTTVKKLSDVLNGFGIRLIRMKNVTDRLAFLLNRETRGLYIARAGIHCIGVDCDRKLIFDNGNTVAVPLSAENFKSANPAFMLPRAFAELRLVEDSHKKKCTK